MKLTESFPPKKQKQTKTKTKQKQNDKTNKQAYTQNLTLWT